MPLAEQLIELSRMRKPPTARVVNDVVYKLCARLTAQSNASPATYWVTEAHLLEQLTTCLLSSQVKFEVALVYASRLAENGTLAALVDKPSATINSQRTLEALKNPNRIRWSCGCSSVVRYRFPLARSRALVATAKKLYGKKDGGGLEQLLSSATSEWDARKRLVTTCVGIGPKQASLFLRNVGAGDDMAVLDAHILEYLRLFWGVDVPTHRVATLSGYEKHEATFRKVASYFGFRVAVVDLAVWLTMRALRRRGRHEHRCSSVGGAGLNPHQYAHQRAKNKAASPVR